MVTFLFTFYFLFLFFINSNLFIYIYIILTTTSFFFKFFIQGKNWYMVLIYVLKHQETGLLYVWW